MSIRFASLIRSFASLIRSIDLRKPVNAPKMHDLRGEPQVPSMRG